MVEQTSARLVIAAQPHEVMAVIADVEAYPEWITHIKQVDILERDESGRPALARFILDAGVVRDDYALAYQWSDDEVRWRLVRGTTIKAMDGGYRLRRVPGGCEVEHSLSLALGVPLLGAFKRKAEQLVTDTALNGLKARMEA